MNIENYRRFWVKAGAIITSEAGILYEVTEDISVENDLPLPISSLRPLTEEEIPVHWR